MIGLVGACFIDAEVIGLFFGQFRQFHAEFFEVEGCDLFIKVLWQHIDADFVFAGVGPEFDLREGLVGEGCRHDEARVACGAS